MSDSKDSIRAWAKRDLTMEANTVMGICEVLRMIYDSLCEIDGFKPQKEQMTERLVDAVLMVKKMAERLAYYRDKYHDDTGNAGHNLKHLLNTRKRKAFRINRERNAYKEKL